MGSSWKINLIDIDPRSDKSMWWALKDPKIEEKAVNS